MTNIIKQVEKLKNQRIERDNNLIPYICECDICNKKDQLRKYETEGGIIRICNKCYKKIINDNWKIDLN